MNNLLFTGTDNVFSNTNISAESFSLDEVLCSSGALDFGSCESNMMKVQIRHNASVIGQEFTVTFNGQAMGDFTVIEDKPTANRCYRNLVLADKMYFILNADMTEWYNSLTFPMTVEAFRGSFFDYFDVEQEECVLPIDDLVLSKIEAIQSITGQKIITDICQLSGCFGNMGRNGKFEYIWLNSKLVPDDELYPSDDLYPGMDVVDYEYGKSYYSSCVYEDYEVETISGVVIVDNQNEKAAIVGEGNVFTITDNFLLYGKTNAECEQVANTLYNIISGVTFTPIDVTAIGNLSLEVGDFIQVNTSNGSVSSFVLQHTLSGIQSLHDNIVSDCTQYIEENKNTLASAIQYLKAEQTEQALRVGTLEADNVTIKGTLTSQSAKIGTLEADNVTIKGSLESQSARIGIIESDYINTAKLNAHTIDADKIVSGTIDANRISASTFGGRVMSAGGVNAGSVTCSSFNVSLLNKTLTPVQVTIGSTQYVILAAQV